MGSKIPEARLVSGIRVSALVYEKTEPKEKVSCCSPGCTALLSFVKRHQRKYAGKKPIEILPCFRLKPLEVHGEQCKYNLNGRLKLIAKKSESEIFTALKQSRFVFRLHVLIKALWTASDEDFIAQAKTWGSKNDSNKAYSNQGRLTNYLKTLRQIIELRDYCENNDQMAKLVELDYNGELIKWHDFYYDSGNLVELVSRHGIGEIQIPLAIAGHVYKISKQTKGYAVELHSPHVSPNSNNILTKPTPKIFLKNPNLLKLIDPDKEYVFFGKWTVSTKQKEPNPKNSLVTVYQNIKMSITEQDHFIEIQ